MAKIKNFDTIKSEYHEFLAKIKQEKKAFVEQHVQPALAQYENLFPESCRECVQNQFWLDKDGLWIMPEGVLTRTAKVLQLFVDHGYHFVRETDSEDIDGKLLFLEVFKEEDQDPDLYDWQECLGNQIRTNQPIFLDVVIMEHHSVVAINDWTGKATLRFNKSYSDFTQLESMLKEALPDLQGWLLKHQSKKDG